jgi:transketolase
MIVEANKSEMSKLFNSTVGKKEYELLLRKIDMGERHYAMVEEHIKTLKGQVDKEAEALQSEFVKRLQSHKQAMHNQLDNYHRTYMQNMEAYRALLEPILTFHGKFKYYCSASSISLKLLSEIRRKSTEWYLDLKRIMTVASRVVDRPLVMQDNLARSTQYMSCVCE